MRILFFIIFLVAFLFSCHKPSVSKHTTEEKSETGCCIIRFSSRGSGIDQERNQKLLNLFQQKSIIYQQKKWGREGEITYFIELNSLKPEAKSALKQLTQEFQENANLIKIEQSKNCNENE